MDFFKINAAFGAFFPYLKSKMDPMDRHKICIMHQDVEGPQDIYIATEEEELKKIITAKFPVKPVEKPVDKYKANPVAWMFRGNQSLMGL
mgnify:CR=1 FL=1